MSRLISDVHVHVAHEKTEDVNACLRVACANIDVNLVTHPVFQLEDDNTMMVTSHMMGTLD